MQTHINHMGLENFRVFKQRTDFDFAPITILTGTNSSGKSSLINAMEMLNGLPLRKKVDTEHGENNYPDVLEDISSLDLYKYASTKGDFSNLMSTNSNDSDCIKFSFGHYLRKLGEVCRITLGYSSKSNKIGYKNGELSELTITAFDKDQTEIEIYSLASKNDVIKVTIDWRFFHDRYKSNGERIVSNATKPKPPIEQGLQVIREAMQNAAIANSSLYYDKVSSAIKIFDPNELFLKNPKFYGRIDQRVESLQKFTDTYQIDVTNDLPQEGASEEAVFEKLHDNLIPHLQQSFLENPKMIYYMLRQSPINGSGFRMALKKIEFDGQLLSGNVKSQGAFESYLYDFEFSLSFAQTPNGKAADLFFNQFILAQIHELLEQVVPEFQGINLLKTNRHFTKRRTEIADLSQVNSQSAFYVNLLIRCNSDAQELILADLSLFFSKEYLGIADEVAIKSQNQTNDSVTVMLRKGDTWFNLLDEGFGVNTVFLVVLMSAMANDSVNTMLKTNHEPGDPDPDEYDRWQSLKWQTVLVIEEPESNLHPALQSKLADVFVHVAEKYNTQFIIETHSEYLIRKLQYLTAKKDIKPEDTVIYYFYPPDHPDVVSGREPQVKKINIDEYGSLTDNFGNGFFDEASTWKFELLKLQNQKSN